MKEINEFADFLKNARIEVNLTQSQVAESLGYSTSQFISNWERGVSSPPLKNLKALSTLYKCRPDDLFERILKISMYSAEQSMRSEYKNAKSKAR